MSLEFDDAKARLNKELVEEAEVQGGSDSDLSGDMEVSKISAQMHVEEVKQVMDSVQVS